MIMLSFIDRPEVACDFEAPKSKGERAVERRKREEKKRNRRQARRNKKFAKRELWAWQARESLVGLFTYSVDESWAWL